jgi:hypothetical protein
MTTTYNNNLRIAEIGTGDQAGVWGNTTNYNLATLLSEAISGIISVTVTGNQALTALDGVTDQSRQAALLLTGTPVAAFTLYMPPVDKIYIISNNTGQTATLSASTIANGTTPTAGTKVDLPTGKTAFIFCDGNNVATGVDFINGTLTVNGDALVSGNGSFSGTGSLGVPVGTSNQRAGTGIRFNTTFSQYEGWNPNTSAWSAIGGGATGNAGNQVFYENSPLVTASYTLSSGKNAVTVGPMQIIPVECTAKIDNGAGLAGTVLTVDPTAAFTASISGTTMTVTAIASGTIVTGRFLNGASVLPSTQIVEQLTGTTGSTGTYRVTVSQTLGSTSMNTITSGVLSVGMVITGTGITANTTITALGTGTGGAGTYTVGTSQLAVLTTVTSAVSVTVPTGQRLVVL